MATVDDIDTNAAVRKFLERQVVIEREDQTADSADEVQAALESVAVAFLLNPQSALYFVLLAKNALQQNIQSDIDIIDYLIKATDDVQSPDTPITDTSDLVEAQAALVEVDRLGRIGSDVRAYDRYSSAINRFLDRQLASSLKRRRRNEFERSGSEAKQDLFRVLAAFEPVHALVSSKLEILSKAVSDFQSVDLTRIVSTRTVSKVRNSLRDVLSAIDRGIASKTVVALELLSGSSSLQSIANTRGIFDPLVETGSLPTNREIRVSSEAAKARVRGSEVELEYDLSAVSPPWVFAMTVDPQVSGGTPYSVTLPRTGASGRAWVASARTDDGFGNFTITDDKLYIHLEGPAPPAYEAAVVVTVTLPTGVQTFSTLVSTINTALSTGGYGNCVELAPNSYRFLIYGSSSVTKITLRSAIPGSFNITTGDYTASDPVANETLGFVDDQESRAIGFFTPAELADLLSLNISGATFSAVDGALEIESDLESIDSSLSFSAGVADELGFSGLVRSEPTYLVLTEAGVEVDPAEFGITIGSLVAVIDLNDTTRSLNGSVSVIDGNHLLFSVSILPRVTNQVVKITSPLVLAVQSILNIVRPYVGTFSDDSRTFQRLLSPLLSRPTLAQVNDAKNGLNDVRTELAALRTELMGVVVREDQTDVVLVARSIISSMEERGLDRAIDLLSEGSFSTFFALTSEVASKSSRFMKSIEELGRNDFPAQVIESRIRDLEAKGTTPQDATAGIALSDDGQDVV